MRLAARIFYLFRLARRKIALSADGLRGLPRSQGLLYLQASLVVLVFCAVTSRALMILLLWVAFKQELRIFLVQGELEHCNSTSLNYPTRSAGESIMSMGAHRVREKYTYTGLADAVLCVKQKVNFYGIVVEYEQPKRTQGTDYLCTMTLIDTCENSPRLRVLYFSPGDTMPHVEKLGDIIRFHRLVINNYLDAPQALGNPKKGSSFMLLHGLEGNGYEPYQMSHSNFTMEAQDRGIVDHFRNWMSSHSIDIFPGTSNKYIKQIKDINVDSYFDLICKILFVNHQDESQNNVIIYVWDGTDASPIHSNPLELDENGVLGQDLWSSKELEVPFDVMCSFPALGTVLPLVPQNAGQDDLGAEPVVAGDWVKLRNINCCIRKGLYEGVILHESKLGLLSPNTEAVRNCERAYAERLTSDALRLPHWCPRPPQSMTVTGYDHVRVSSLREVLTYPQVTYKFRCMVRVMATWPLDVLDFCQPKHEDFVYVVRLTLEDSTARLHAYLYDQDAVDFFVGHPACNMRLQGDTVGALRRKVERLLGVNENGPPNPPWVNCCLMSYCVDKERPRESRHYRIFGTRFPG